MDLASINEELAEIDRQIGDILHALQNGFQMLEKIKDANRRSRQLEEITDKMRDCKRLQLIGASWPCFFLIVAGVIAIIIVKV